MYIYTTGGTLVLFDSICLRYMYIYITGGTLVLFDSVCVPHEVLATRGRERYACSGWFHERLEV